DHRRDVLGCRRRRHLAVDVQFGTPGFPAAVRHEPQSQACVLGRRRLLRNVNRFAPLARLKRHTQLALRRRFHLPELPIRFSRRRTLAGLLGVAFGGAGAGGGSGGQTGAGGNGGGMATGSGGSAGRTATGTGGAGTGGMAGTGGSATRGGTTGTGGSGAGG